MKLTMKLRLLVVPCAITAFAVSLGGCVSYGQTRMLVTPVGVAGIHKFAPPNKTPDTLPALPEKVADSR